MLSRGCSIYIAQPSSVVSKCALAGKQKSLPCVKGGGTACRDGGIVKGESSSLNNPSAAFGVSSLYTREPLAVFARLPAIPFIKLSLRTLRLCRGLCFFSYIFARISRATYTPLAEACESEWVTPEPSPITYRPGQVVSKFFASATSIL